MSLSVAVSNISPLIQRDHIRELFNCCGPIAKMTWEPGADENLCTLSFADPKHTKAAVLLSGTPLGDSTIIVTEMAPPPTHTPTQQPQQPQPPQPTQPTQQQPTQPVQTPQNTLQMMPPSIPSSTQMSMMGWQMGAAGGLMNNNTFTPLLQSSSTTTTSSLSAGQQLPMTLTSTLPNGLTGVQITPSSLLPPAPVIPFSALNAQAAALMPSSDPVTQRRVEELILVARTVYVGNLAPHITEQHLRAFFSKYGNVNFVKMAGNPLQAVRYAFMEFDSQDSATRVMALSGTDAILEDRQLKIGPAMNPIVKPAGPAARSNPSAVEAAMRKVREAKERLERKKGRKPRSRSRSPSDSRRRRSRSRDRYESSRYRRRSRSPRRRRSRSPIRSSRGGGGGKKNPHEGMIWDGFQWNPPAEVALKQTQRALAVAQQQQQHMNTQTIQESAATDAAVKQAAEQARELRMNKFG